MIQNKEDARSALSTAGVFAPWYLRPSQLDIYELLTEHTDPFIEASRRFGKTTSIAIFVHELLIRNPGWICRWCAPDQKQARQIVKPIFNHIQNSTPAEHRAEWRTMDSHYVYPNGSMLYLVGVNQDKGESARGPAANIIVLDEYGFWVEAEYIAKSILYPQLQSQAGQWFIKASTPPPNLDHIYYVEKKIAMRKQRFVQKIIWDNEALSQGELDKIIEETGGQDTIAFRREYLCEEIADPKRVIIPEFTDLNLVDDEYPRPEYFDGYVSIDSGADDNTACLFAWYDFKKNEIVVDQEYFNNGVTTRTIISECKRIEKELWEEKKAYKRVYDGDKQLVYDVIGDHAYEVQLPRKQDRIASIHELRTEIKDVRFKIKKRCVHLAYQLKVGMWKNEKHLDFERSKTIGHLDGIASAMYLQRSIERDRNPWPANHGLHRETHFITPTATQLGESAQAFQKVFGGKSRRFR